MPASTRQNRYAFLNLPYDAKHEQICLAFVAGLCAFGLVPRATLELSGSERRLDRIVKLIKRCRYSFHDLSRVELDRTPPRTPRFNMPFELGLAVARASEIRHQWFVFEAIEHRLNKSLSDIDGTDPQIHKGHPEGVLRGLSNVLGRSAMRPRHDDLMAIYRELKRGALGIKRQRGGSLFEAAAFRELVFLAREFAGRNIAPLKK